MTRNAIDSLTEGNIHLKYFKGYLCFLLNILSDSCWLILLIECISLEVLTDRTAIPGHPRQSQGRLGTEDNSSWPRMEGIQLNIHRQSLILHCLCTAAVRAFIKIYFYTRQPYRMLYIYISYIQQYITL